MDPFVDKVLVCGAFICLAIIGEPKLFNFPTVIMVIIKQWLVSLASLRCVKWL